MSIVRKMSLFCGTLICALGIGYVMQGGSGGLPHPATLAPTPIQQSDLNTAPAALKNPIQTSPNGVSRNASQMDLTDVTLVAAAITDALPNLLAVTPSKAALTRNDGLLKLPNPPADPAIPQLGCQVIASAQPAPAASVRLSISAPCYGNERLTVHHSGMMFTDSTDEDGMLIVDVPALAENAIFVVAFANGKGVVAQTQVTSLNKFDRIVLQWSGRQGFQIHAREFGADYGEIGHVWAGGLQTRNDAQYGQGGYVTRLGDSETLAPQLVEIYTFPSATIQQSGTVTMSIETEVTQANCGREVEAQTLELTAKGGLHTRDLVLSVPNCTAIGDFLVLNNLVNDLKVAGN